MSANVLEKIQTRAPPIDRRNSGPNRYIFELILFRFAGSGAVPLQHLLQQQGQRVAHV